MQSWADIELTAVAATGVVKQIYPTWCPVGVDPSAANAGDQIRRPDAGNLARLEIVPDGTNAGTLELWDVNGHDVGADVSSDDEITNAQLSTLITAGKAKLIYKRAITASATPQVIDSIGTGFLHGLAARFSNAGPAGACTLHLMVTKGGFCLTTQAGDK